jgi:hypothetical protein
MFFRDAGARGPELLPMLEVLVAGGTALDTRLQGNTPLMRLVLLPAYNQEIGRCVEILLNAGADVHAVNDNGNTALHMCVDSQVRALLIARGARPDAVNLAWQSAVPGAGCVTELMYERERNGPSRSVFTGAQLVAGGLDASDSD